MVNDITAHARAEAKRTHTQEYYCIGTSSLVCPDPESLFSHEFIDSLVTFTDPKEFAGMPDYRRPVFSLSPR